MRKGTLLTALLSLVVGTVLEAALPSSARAQDDDWIGYVSHVDGAWRIGEEQVELGQTVNVGDTLRVDPNASESHSLAVVLESGRRVRFLCDVPAACSGPFVPADSIRGESLLDGASRIVRAVAGVFRSEPGRFVSLVSRGGTTTSRYAALERVGDRIDVTPLLEREPAGRYRIELEPVDREFEVLDRDEGDEPTTRSIVDWTPDRPSERSVWVEVPEAAACLYHVRTTSLSSLQPSSSGAWAHATAYPDSALVRYDDVKAGVEETVRLAGGWRDAVDGERDSFVLGYLEYASRAWCWTDA